MHNGLITLWLCVLSCTAASIVKTSNHVSPASELGNGEIATNPARKSYLEGFTHAPEPSILEAPDSNPEGALDGHSLGKRHQQRDIHSKDALGLNPLSGGVSGTLGGHSSAYTFVCGQHGVGHGSSCISSQNRPQDSVEAPQFGKTDISPEATHGLVHEDGASDRYRAELQSLHVPKGNPALPMTAQQLLLARLSETNSPQIQQAVLNRRISQVLETESNILESASGNQHPDSVHPSGGNGQNEGLGYHQKALAAPSSGELVPRSMSGRLSKILPAAQMSIEAKELSDIDCSGSYADSCMQNCRCSSKTTVSCSPYKTSGFSFRKTTWNVICKRACKCGPLGKVPSRGEDSDSSYDGDDEADQIKPTSTRRTRAGSDDVSLPRSHRRQRGPIASQTSARHTAVSSEQDGSLRDSSAEWIALANRYRYKKYPKLAGQRKSGVRRQSDRTSSSLARLARRTNTRFSDGRSSLNAGEELKANPLSRPWATDQSTGQVTPSVSDGLSIDWSDVDDEHVRRKWVKKSPSTREHGGWSLKGLSSKWRAKKKKIASGDRNPLITPVSRQE